MAPASAKRESIELKSLAHALRMNPSEFQATTAMEALLSVKAASTLSLMTPRGGELQNIKL